MPALAGRKALIGVGSVSTPFTDAVASVVTPNTVYQGTVAVYDPTVALTVKKDTVPQSSTLWTVNRLTGRITFLSDIGGGHTITSSGSYFPIAQAAQAKDYTYNLTAQNLDVSKFGDTWIPRVQGLKDVSGTLSGWKIDTYFSAALLAGNPIMIEFWSDSATTYDLRVWALLNKQQLQAAIDGAVEESIDFIGATDIDHRSISG